MSTSNIIILFITVLICYVSNQEIEDGMQIFLTNENHVKSSMIVPVDSQFTMENANALPVLPHDEIKTTGSLPVDRMKLPGNFESTYVLTTDSVDAVRPTAAYTIIPTTILAPIITKIKATPIDEKAGSISPTQVVSSGASGSYTSPPNNLTPAKVNS
ncbi:unnamed protein product [Euphydryas editha]|uniref:Uncharacterized protein n=1 Tax=Euphydryas editha TaxID=104508 RepID=A0AAU9V1B6_EUPED|nr:unnamed protein product [Euphydryas editha]